MKGLGVVVLFLLVVGLLGESEGSNHEQVHYSTFGNGDGSGEAEFVGENAENVIQLHDMPNVLHTTCKDEYLALIIDGELPAFPVGALMTGLCEDEVTPLYRTVVRVASHATVHGKFVVRIDTVETPLNLFFKSMRSLRLNVAPGKFKMKAQDMSKYSEERQSASPFRRGVTDEETHRGHWRRLQEEIRAGRSAAHGEESVRERAAVSPRSSRRRELWSFGGAADAVGDWVEDRIDEGREAIGDLIDDALGLLEGIVEFWENLIDDIIALFDDVRLDETFPFISKRFHYEGELPIENAAELLDDGAVELGVGLSCVNCEFELDSQISVLMEFGSLLEGVKPKKIHIGIKGSVAGQVKVRADSPDLPGEAQLPNLWKTISPELYLGTYTVFLGYIPVIFVLYGTLKGAATSEGDVQGGFTIGADFSVEGVVSMDWTEDAGVWEETTTFTPTTGFFIPTWDITASSNSFLKVHLQPEVAIALYDLIPAVIKPKPWIGARFGSMTDGTVDISGSLGEDIDLNCGAGDQFQIVWGVDLGMGLTDITIPSAVEIIAELVDVDIGGVTLIGGHDFGQFPVITDTSFGDCGQLCAGCMGETNANYDALVSQAYAHSIDKQIADAGKDPAMLAAAVLCVLGVVGLAAGAEAYVRRDPARLRKFNSYTPDWVRRTGAGGGWTSAGASAWAPSEQQGVTKQEVSTVRAGPSIAERMAALPVGDGPAPANATPQGMASGGRAGGNKPKGKGGWALPWGKKNKQGFKNQHRSGQRPGQVQLT